MLKKVETQTREMDLTKKNLLEEKKQRRDS